MRLLHLPHGYPPANGGAEHLARGWSEGLAARGHAVQVSVADLATPEGLYRFGISPTGRPDEVLGDVAIHRLRLDPAYRAGGLLFRRHPYAASPVAGHIRKRVRHRLAVALRAEVRRFAPDVVLTLPHLFENVRIVLGLRDELGFPLVWAPMLHETDPNWPFAAVRAATSRVDALVAMTRIEADRLVDGYGARPERVHVVPPGVDVPSSPPEPTDGAPTVLFVGRISAAKGLDVLAGAMPAVWERIPDARLIIAGTRTPDLPDIRRSFAASAPPGPDSFVFRVDVSEREKQRLLDDATILVLPSERESFGIVLLEAWARATPVIAVDMPAMRETVRDGTDGRLFTAGDAPALAGALIERLNDPEGSRRMGIAGHDRVRRDFTWDAVSGRLESVYERVRGKKHR